MTGARTVGFVGVGEIASAMVEGLATADPPADRLVLSPRGRERVADLASRFPEVVRVAGSNQEVVDAAETVVVAVLPQDALEVIGELTFREGQVVVSAVAGVGIAEVREAVGVDVPVVRAVPMPPVRHHAVASVVTPEHPAAAEIFDRLGGTLPVADEAALSVFSAATGAVSGYLNYLSVVCSWAAAQGVPQETAERFLRSLFAALGPAIVDAERSIDEVVTDHETPGGLNQQLRTTFFDDARTAELRAGLDALLARITGG